MADINQGFSKNSVEDYSSRVSNTADKAINATRAAADGALDAAQAGVNDLREKIPSKIHESATKVEDLMRSGVDRARNATEQVKNQVNRAGECTAAYVREEPIKALLIATAAGAALAGIIRWMSRSRASRA